MRHDGDQLRECFGGELLLPGPFKASRESRQLVECDEPRMTLQFGFQGLGSGGPARDFGRHAGGEGHILPIGQGVEGAGLKRTQAGERVFGVFNALVPRRYLSDEFGDGLKRFVRS